MFIYTHLQGPGPLLIKKKQNIFYQPVFPKAMWDSFAVIIIAQIKKLQHSKVVGNIFCDVRAPQKHGF